MVWRIFLIHTLTIAALAPSVCLAGDTLAKAALIRTDANVIYDGSYRRIAYPGGDVPSHIGVCSDVLIRSYRSLGIDLQVLVHEDMSAHFDVYPDIWGLSKPDPNIDHRRVPNLETFFKRHGTSLPLSTRARDYAPGDIVSWRLGGTLPHVGIVSPNKVSGTDRYYIVHNIGAGPKEEDVLFKYRLHGHYRYEP